MKSKEGEQIPKATMSAYLKQKFGKTKLSTDFIDGILQVSKQYITTIANKANQICTNQNKKTINLEHLYKSFEHYQLNVQLPQLKKVESDVKQEVANKQQMKLNIQKSYHEMTKEKLDEPVRKPEIQSIIIKDKIDKEIFKKQSEQEDYEDMNNDEQVEEFDKQ